MALTLTSHAFQNEAPIPAIHSKDGGNASPALSWSGVPKDTRSLVLIVEDPDAPSGLFTHWIVYGIDPKTSGLKEGVPAASHTNGVRQGLNGFGQIGYGGPKPPSGTHRYFFRLYALDTDTGVAAVLGRQEIEGVIEGHIIEEATLMGRFARDAKVRTAR